MHSGDDETLKIHCLPVVEDELVISIDEGHAITCPFCGSVVVTIADGCVLPPCEHTQFIFINGEGFEYAEAGLEAWLKEQEERADEDEECCGFDVWDALQTYVEPDGLILERIDHGMACGPIKLTIWVGISETVPTLNPIG